MTTAIRRALLSVSDKTGLIEFAQGLSKLGVELISTGGTAKAIAQAGLTVRDVADVTGFPEIMDGRVKTLHPKVHGGLLAVRGNDEHSAAQKAHDIENIDMLVVNLYPFEDTIARGASLNEAIENIDIGGPAMTRAAAKNHASVTVLCDPADYDEILGEMNDNAGATTPATRQKLAAKAFARTAAYDGAIGNYLSAIIDSPEQKSDGFPRWISLQYVKAQDMRYGENPHQKAAFYVEKSGLEASVSTAQQLQGKALSFNNIADTDAALECVKQFNDRPTCVIVKHANPCGVAQADDLASAYDRAYATDSESAFGGIIAVNQKLDGATAKMILDRQFVEVIIAPEISPEAVAVAQSKKNVRLLACGQWPQETAPRYDYCRVNGGMLVQESDQALYDKLTTVSRRAPSEQEMGDLLFAWKVTKFVKSNAIIYAREKTTIGIGAGQMSRVNSARIATIKAGHAGLEITGAVVASDAFFPFADGLLQAAQEGVRAVIQPGGSMRDDEVIDAADEAGLAMVFTGMRHFRH